MILNKLFEKRNALKVFKEELYPHIGYGFLDKRSVRWENSVMKADYRMEGIRVLTVIRMDHTFDFYDYFGEKKVGFSGGNTMDIAIQYAYAAKDQFKSLRFEYLKKKYLLPYRIFCDSTPGRADFNPVFVPDGLRLGLEVIETLDNKSELHHYINSIDKGSHLKISQERQILILVLLSNGEVTVETKRMVEFSMPVAYIPYFIPRMANAGILTRRPDKFFLRAYIINYQMKGINILRYRLNDQQPEEMLMWVKDVMSIKSPDKVIENFRNMSWAYIESEKNMN